MNFKPPFADGPRSGVPVWGTRVARRGVLLGVALVVPCAFVVLASLPLWAQPEAPTQGDAAQTPSEEKPSPEEVAAPKPADPEAVRRELSKIEDVAEVGIRASSFMGAKDQAIDQVLRELLAPTSSQELIEGILTAFRVLKAERFLPDVLALYSEDSRVELEEPMVEAVRSLTPERALTLLRTVARDRSASPSSRRGAVAMLGAMAIPDRAVVADLIELLREGEALFTNSPNLLAQALERMTREPLGSDVASWLDWWEPIKELSPLDFWAYVMSRLESRLRDAEGHAFDSWKSYTEDLRGRKDQGEAYFNRLLAGLQDETSVTVRRYSASKIKEARVHAFLRSPDRAGTLLEVIRKGEPAVFLDVSEALGSWVRHSEGPPEEVVQAIAATAVELAARLQKPSNSSVQADLVKALGFLKQPGVVPTLLEWLAPERSESMRAEVVLALGRIGDVSVVERLGQVLVEGPRVPEDPGWKVRANAAIALGWLGDPTVIDLLSRALSSDSKLRVRFRSAEALASLGREHRDRVERISLGVRVGLGDSEKEIRKACADHLLQLGTPLVLDDLIENLPDPDPVAREAKVAAIAGLASAEADREKALPHLLERCRDSESRVAGVAIDAVARFLKEDGPRARSILDRFDGQNETDVAILVGTKFLELNVEEERVEALQPVREKLALLLAGSDQPQRLENALQLCTELSQSAPPEQKKAYLLLEAQIQTGLGSPGRALELLGSAPLKSDANPRLTEAERWGRDFETVRAEFVRAQKSRSQGARLPELFGLRNRFEKLSAVGGAEDLDRTRRVKRFGEDLSSSVRARLVHVVGQMGADEGAQAPPELVGVRDVVVDEVLGLLEADGGESAVRESAFRCLKSLLEVDETFPMVYDAGSGIDARRAAVEQVRQWRVARERN